MKKKILCFFIFLIFIVSIIIIFFILKKQNVINVSKKESNSNFEINKIKYYSSCNALTNTTNYQNPEWNVKVYQYTDMAIYLERLGDASIKNYITNLSISNFKLLDNQEVYYLDPTMFGNSNINSDDIISNDKELNYNVINSSNNDNEQNYNIPIFFQDCSIPITLRFVNNLSDNYKISSEDTLIYNGSLIKKLGMDLKNINTKFSFDLKITTKDGDEKTKQIDINIPIENDKRSILDGDFEIEVKENIKI